MEKLITGIFLLFLFHSGIAQDSTSMKAELVKEIRSYPGYPNPYNQKEKWDPIDQLWKLSALSDYYQYARDTSVVLRLIGFAGVMQNDPEHVFELLKEYVHDSSTVFVTAPSCSPGDYYSYNFLIAHFYYSYLSYGCEGSSGTIALANQELVFVTDPQKKKLYRRRKKEFEFFIESSGYRGWVKYWKNAERVLRKCN